MNKEFSLSQLEFWRKKRIPLLTKGGDEAKIIDVITNKHNEIEVYVWIIMSNEVLKYSSTLKNTINNNDDYDIIGEKIDTEISYGLERPISNETYPNMNESYWYVKFWSSNSSFTAEYGYWEESPEDIFRFHTGNCFNTKNKASEFITAVTNKHRLL